MRYGYGPLEPDEAPMLHCPVCQEELNRDDLIYTNSNGVVIGCEFCIDHRAAEDMIEE